MGKRGVNLRAPGARAKAVRALLTDKEVWQVHDALFNGLTHRSIAAMSGWSMSQIGHISANYTYWWVAPIAVSEHRL
jgi:hypothetical protein